MSPEGKNVGEQLKEAVDWFYVGDRLPDTMMACVLVAIAAQACEILSDGREKKEPASVSDVSEQVLSD